MAFCNVVGVVRAEFGYKRIQLEVISTNAPAAAPYCKVDIVDEGERRKALLIDGFFIDEFAMAQFAEMA